MNIDMLDSVKDWLDEFIRKSSKLVVVQFQPLQTECSILFGIIFHSRVLAYLVRSSNVGVGISEILKKNELSILTYILMYQIREKI